MKRERFIRRLFQILILAVMSVVVFLLGNRVVSGNDCNSCPGKGICSGETDCGAYKKD